MNPERLHNLVQKITNAGAVLRGDLDDRLDAEPVEIHRGVARSFVVYLVDREDHRPVGLAQLAGDRLVARHESVAPVDDHDE